MTWFHGVQCISQEFEHKFQAKAWCDERAAERVNKILIGFETKRREYKAELLERQYQDDKQNAQDARAARQSRAEAIAALQF